jgi:glycolate oxidase FAD binding subunit
VSAPSAIRDSRVSDIVGAQNVISDPQSLAAYSVDEVTPQIAARPASAQEVSDLVKFAAAEKLAVIPIGARTKLAIGMPPARYDLAIDMTRLDRVISYDPGDLTLSVEPGIPLVRLAEVLAEHNQFLPLDVPFYDRATAGGTLASGVDSYLRQAYGTARDFVLGMEFVSGDGALTKSGGRVVKNVSGYDLHKLFLGSIGSLGIITRINFKTFPLLRNTATFVASFPNANAAADFNLRIRKSPLRCQSVEILSPTAAQALNAAQPEAILSENNSAWRVAVSVSGNDETLARAHHDMQTLSRGDGANSSLTFARLEGIAEKLLWIAIRELPALASHSGAVVKLSCLPTALAVLCDETAAIAEKHSISASHLFHGVGAGYCALAARNTSASSLGECTRELLLIAQKSGAHASIPCCPLELKHELSVWGPPREDFILHQQLKRAFDPHNIFAPGRFLGGL